MRVKRYKTYFFVITHYIPVSRKMRQEVIFQNNNIKNCDKSTTDIKAIGYVAAYAEATFSVPATFISVPSAGVLVIPRLWSPDY